MSIKRIFTIFFSICITHVSAQFYETGQTPVDISWMEINSENFTVVYPSEIEQEAVRFTHFLETSYPYVSKALGHQPRKVPILLNNQSVASNGLVAWAPKRMEIITTPPQNTYSQPWLQQLALHELRHVVQVDKLNKKWFRFLSFPFGQISTGAAAGFLPFWFLEGDAVISETSLSNAGRGDLPEFKMGSRAIVLENEKPYPYKKSYFGSYKNFVPNYYEYGYLLTSYARMAYNPFVWDTVLNYIPKLPFTFAPFHFGLKHYGTNKKQLHQDAFQYYKKHWQKLQENNTSHAFNKINSDKPKNNYIGYNHVQAIDQNRFVVLKTSLSDIPTLYVIDRKGNEQKLHSPGIIRDFSLSYANNMLAWAEQVPDPLWSKKNYSVIKLFDMARKKEFTIRDKTRYFSPDLAPDTSKMVVIENTFTHENNLNIIDIRSGQVLQKIPIPGNRSAQNPRWDHTGSRIVMTVLGNEGKSMMIYNLTSQSWQTVFGPTFEIVSNPVFYGDDYIIFNGSFNEIGNIFALEISSSEVYQLTSSRFGAYNPDVLAETNEIIYADYTLKNYDLIIADINLDRRIILNKPDEATQPHEIIRRQENWSLNESNIENAPYKLEKYNRLLHLFNFHSWLPFYADLDNLSPTDPAIYPGIQLFSQNLLNTAITTLGYSYRDDNHFFSTTFAYKGIRPIFEFSMDIGGDIQTLAPKNIEIPQINQTYFTQEYRLYMPLELTNSKYFTRLVPSLEVDYRRNYYFNFQQRRFQEGITFFQPGILFYRLRKMAHRDIHPKFGQVIQAELITSPVDRQNFGPMTRLFGTAYFPGLFSNHSLVLKANYQEQDVKNYFLPYQFSYPPGFEAIRATDITTLSVDYTLPILYPDIDMISLAYLKRIRATGFYDYLIVSPLSVQNGQLVDIGSINYQSFGIELVTDFHLLNMFLPISAGYRLGYQPEKDRLFGEFLFNLDISQL